MLKKSIIAGTLGLFILTTITSAYNLRNGIDLFVAHSEIYTYLRVCVIGVLSILLVTKVPRSLATRLFVGTSGLALVLISVSQLMTYQMSLFDGLMFLVVANIFIIEALERVSYPVSAKYKLQGR